MRMRASANLFSGLILLQPSCQYEDPDYAPSSSCYAPICSLTGGKQEFSHFVHYKDVYIVDRSLWPFQHCFYEILFMISKFGLGLNLVGEEIQG